MCRAYFHFTLSYVLSYLITSSQCQVKFKRNHPGPKLRRAGLCSRNSIYLDMERTSAHINDLPEQDGLGVLDTFQQFPPLHANLPPSYPADRTADRSVFYLSPGNTTTGLTAKRRVGRLWQEHDKNKHPKLRYYFMLFLPCISLSANNPSHNPFCHLVLADMSAYFSC